MTSSGGHTNTQPQHPSLDFALDPTQFLIVLNKHLRGERSTPRTRPETGQAVDDWALEARFSSGPFGRLLPVASSVVPLMKP